MIGIDTSFLVAFEIAEHPKHNVARSFARERASEGFALGTQVLTEFCHVVTDPKRFERPLSIAQATHCAHRWVTAREITIVPSREAAVMTFVGLMQTYALGRTRLLDTMLAATYIAAEVHTIVTIDARDFARFAGFAPLVL